MRILVTGVTGFVGQHLVHAWRQQFPTAEIWGVLRKAEAQASPLHGHFTLDLAQETAVSQLSQDCAFDWVVHLAAQSFVPESFARPQETWKVNLWGTFYLLEALRQGGFQGRLLFVGSGGVYGQVADDHLPVHEQQPLRPLDPYTASKAAAELLCYQYGHTAPFDIVLTRPFNHIGPGQSSQFVVSNFARQVAQIDLGRQEPTLTVGNIAVTRDFLDVRDVVDAYRCLLERGQRGEVYNVCSGRETPLAEVIATLVGCASCPIEVRRDPTRLRPTDTPRVCGSHEKLTTHTGWQPRRDITTTLQEVVTYWKGELTR
ncbi:MAG: NAD-dependent epimerase/dehydratase family protein [Deltaproteobacteria bacterium]|nr:NAD-dependent epimerase/dehydratase family protein [Deltaproteobacteria bacterium]